MAYVPKPVNDIPWGEKPHGATHYYTGPNPECSAKDRWRRVTSGANERAVIWGMDPAGGWSVYVTDVRAGFNIEHDNYIPVPEHDATVPHETPPAPAKPEILTDIKGITEDIVSFLDQVYPNRSLDSLIKKLKEEMGELEREPLNGWEMADVLIVLFDLCDMAGFDIAKLVHHKMQINRQRKWHLKDGVLHHVTDR